MILMTEKKLRFYQNISCKLYNNSQFTEEAI